MSNIFHYIIILFFIHIRINLCRLMVVASSVQKVDLLQQVEVFHCNQRCWQSFHLEKKEIKKYKFEIKQVFSY